MSSAVPSGTEGVTEETVLLPVTDARGAVARHLSGTLALPEDPSPAAGPAVVTIHGWGGVRCGPHRIFVRLGRALAGRGVPALRFDLSGRGESEGVAAETCLDDMIEDTCAAIRFLRERTGRERISCCGLCSGGNVAIGAATLETCERLALVSLLPFAPPDASRAARRTGARLMEFARKGLSPHTWGKLLRGEVNWGGVGKTIAAAANERGADAKLKDSGRDIPAAFAAHPLPCLFVYGSADAEAAPAWKHYEAYCRQHRIPAQYLLVEGANHNYYARPWSEEVERAVADFLTAE